MASELENVRAKITALEDDIRRCSEKGNQYELEITMRNQLVGLQNKENVLLQGEIA